MNKGRFYCRQQVHLITKQGDMPLVKKFSIPLRLYE